MSIFVSFIDTKQPTTSKASIPVKKKAERTKSLKTTECSTCTKKFVFRSITVRTDDGKIQYMCKQCLKKEKSPPSKTEFLCTVCHRFVKKSCTVVFRLDNFNRDMLVVQNTLVDKYRLCEEQILEHICLKCKYRLNVHKASRKAHVETWQFPPCVTCRQGDMCPASELILLNKALSSETPSVHKVMTPSTTQSTHTALVSHSLSRYILGQFQAVTTYEELESYVNSLPTFPDLPPMSGNTHLQKYFRDMTAVSLLPEDCTITKPFPVYTRGDGSCFFNALSMAVYGDQTHAEEMRVRIVIEGVKNIDDYVDADYLGRGYDCPDHQANKSLVVMYCDYSSNGADVTINEDLERASYKSNLFDIRLSNNWCGIWQFHHAASVLKRPLHSIYPVMNAQTPWFQNMRTDFNRLILPRESNDLENEPVHIMWSSTGAKAASYNHFVLVVQQNDDIQPVHECNIPILDYITKQQESRLENTHFDLTQTESTDEYCNRKVKLEQQSPKHVQQNTHFDLTQTESTDEHCNRKVKLEQQSPKHVQQNRKRKHQSTSSTCEATVHNITPTQDEQPLKRKCPAPTTTDPANVLCVCKCCHSAITKQRERRIFRETNYDWDIPLVHANLKQYRTLSGKQHLCDLCHSKYKKRKEPIYQTPDSICRCCKRGCDLRVIDVQNYDWSHETITKTLGDSAGSNFICKTCHNNLRIKDKQPTIPRHATAHPNNADTNTKARRCFRKKCKEFPEYVCTVCHRILFSKSVHILNMEKYDATNQNVQDAFQHHYKAPNANEFICHTCHSNLADKDLPKIPAQAVANGLVLDEIPEDLQGLTRLERRCIAGKIPFMNIQSLKKGGQKKISGPCINVPASMQPMAELLPRIPEDMKIVLVKLKRKLEYKSYYIFDSIRPDKVMKALQYLKAHHPYYKNVTVNHDWPDQLRAHADLKFLAEATTDNCIPQSDAGTSLHENADQLPSDEPNVDDKVEAGTNRQGGQRAESNDVTLPKDSKLDRDQSATDELDEKLSDDEFDEDQTYADVKAQITADPSPTCVQIENVDETIFSIAPGENSVPQLVICDPDFEKVSWPDYFSKANGAFNLPDPRKTKLDLRRYVNHRLLNYKANFAQDFEYLFAMQHTVELNQLESAGNTMLRSRKGNNYNAGMLRNPEKVQDIYLSDHAYKFMKTIRGTPAYWQQRLYDSLAMMKMLGKPTWFLTLSPAEFLWVEFIQAIGRRMGKNYTDEEVEEMPYGVKADLLRNNPVICAQMWENRLNSFFTDYILSDACPLGKVTDFFWKIEFQARGSPHAHILLWVKGAPELADDDSNDEVVAAYIDKHCTGQVPNDESNCLGRVPLDTKYGIIAELATKLQSHVHSAYCRRHKNSKCRFSFPRPACPRTIIARPPTDEQLLNIDEKANTEMIAKVREEVELDNSRSLAEILEKCDITEDAYVKALKVTGCSGPTVILKREPKDVNINNYNMDITTAWRANTDVQWVQNPYSAITYVCSYMMKAERGMSDLIKRIAKEFQSEGVKQQMKGITKEFSGKREVSIQEAAMRVLSMPLYHKSRIVRYLCSNPASSRIAMPKQKDLLEALPEDSDDVFKISMHERYEARPEELDNTCLAAFAMSYDLIDEKQFNVKSAKALGRIKLSGDKGFMRLRKEQAVLRTKKLTPGTESFYFGKLLLFNPYRRENEIGATPHESFADHYYAVEDVILENSKPFNLHEELVDNALEMYEQHESNTDSEGQSGQGKKDADESGVGDTPRHSALAMKFRAEARKDIMSKEQYFSSMRQLNLEQRQIVMFNRAYVKKCIREIKAGISPEEGYKVFLSGSGGVGKSFVVGLMNRDTIHLYSNSQAIDPSDCFSRSRDPDKPTALLTALTGNAAFNIGGSTIHSTLQLHAEVLSDEKKTILTTQLHQLQQLTYDEVSMLGFKLMNRTNERCSLIKRQDPTKHNFGKINQLAVGDLYQIAPVCQTPIYKRPREIAQLSDLGDVIWEGFKLHELTQVMRQKDAEFANILNTVRVRPPQENDYVDNAFKKCELTVPAFHKDYPNDALHVYAQNAFVAERNAEMLKRNPGQLYTSKAYDSTHPHQKDLQLSKKAADTGNLEQQLELKLGARVLLTNNLDVADGLTNGAYGTVAGVITKDNNPNKITAVIVKFDHQRVGIIAQRNSPYKKEYPGCVPICQVEVTFVKSTTSNTIQVTRRQFPLFLGWAVTIHKVQGMTLDAIVVDMTKGKGRFYAGQAYVAVSRVRSKEKLYIIGYDKSQFKVNREIADEMTRLRQNRVIPPLPSPIQSMKEHFRIGHLNIQGLRTKTIDKCEDIKLDADMQCLDVICLTETHLSGQAIDEKQFSTSNNYALNRRDRQKQGGGILMAVRSHYGHKIIDLSQVTQLEIVCSLIIVPDLANETSFFLFCIYIPPNQCKQTAASHLKEILSTYKDHKCVVLGDVNENLLDPTVNSHIKCCLSELGYIQHIKDPTTDHCDSLLDHIYTLGFNDVTVDVQDTYYSDHDKTMCAINSA